jgi:hypothetical protein
MTDYGKWYEAFISDKSDEEIKALDKMYENTGNIRSIVQAQVWQKVLSTEPSDE